ncbi:CD3324 family protein [uncultured Acetatifactor sp.]|jgi:Mor family transcriptional regulator|uniref:CD3324 family protein n=1 Tax=uncultured Acetatifactor sp. TaxID=1671927 RepID=UPI00260CF098|nr:CD3324 family protein [uncultured Acetatifactor sp.]
MGYRRAEEILPAEIIEIIQRYVDGENIYIPKKAGNRRQWGSGTPIRQELLRRNRNIYADWLQGAGCAELAGRYFLSEKSIQRIVKDMRCETQ